MPTSGSGAASSCCEPSAGIIRAGVERPLRHAWQRQAHFRLNNEAMSPKIPQTGTQGAVRGIDIDQCQRADRGCRSEEVFQSRGFAGGNLMHEATCTDNRSAFFMQEGRQV